MPLEFEWDSRKARSNLQKHGIAFEDAATVFGAPMSITIDDLAHSQAEDRFVTLGQTDKSVVVVVCHCDRGNRVRIISAAGNQ